MNRDYRASVAHADHPKVEKLTRLVGEIAFRCLHRLWAYTAMNRPSGELLAMDHDDVEIAAGWRGERGALVNALVKVRLLDRAGDGTLSVHDWCEHNEYASHDAERSERQRLNAHRRHCAGPGACEVAYCPNHQKEPVAHETEPVAQPLAATGSAKPAFGSAPVPSPVPSPVPVPVPSPVPVQTGEGRGKRARAHFDESSSALRLASEFLELLRRLDPKAKADLQRWADTFDKLMRVDGREETEIRTVMTFALTDPRESTYTKSPDALRRNFTGVVLKQRKVVPIRTASERDERKRDEFAAYES